MTKRPPIAPPAGGPDEPGEPREPPPAGGAPPTDAAAATLRELFFGFLVIGLSSFGGGVTAHIRRLVVQRKGWMTDAQLLRGLSMAQLLPGANVVNLAIFVGQHLRGLRGAAVSAAALSIPPGVLMVVLGALLYAHGQPPFLRAVFSGVGAAAVGLTLGTALALVRHSLRGLGDGLIVVATFALVALVRVPLPLAILIMAPLGIAWHRPRKPGVDGPAKAP